MGKIWWLVIRPQWWSFGSVASVRLTGDGGSFRDYADDQMRSAKRARLISPGGSAVSRLPIRFVNLTSQLTALRLQHTLLRTIATCTLCFSYHSPQPLSTPLTFLHHSSGPLITHPSPIPLISPGTHLSPPSHASRPHSNPAPHSAFPSRSILSPADPDPNRALTTSLHDQVARLSAIASSLILARQEEAERARRTRRDSVEAWLARTAPVEAWRGDEEEEVRRPATAPEPDRGHAGLVASEGQARRGRETEEVWSTSPEAPPVRARPLLRSPSPVLVELKGEGEGWAG